MKLELLSIAVAVLVIGCTVLWIKNRTQAENYRTKMKSVILNQTVGQLLSDKVVLVELRENRLDNALDCLEYSLDTSIATVWQLAKELERDSGGPAVQSLRIVRGYRNRYRAPSSELKATETAEEEERRKARVRAAEILREIPPDNNATAEH